VQNWFLQDSCGVRFDWGMAAAAALGPVASFLVIVDVLSFSTAVTLAVEAGARVFPHPWRHAEAAEFARSKGAQIGVCRSNASAGSPWSLSPAALRRAPSAGGLVLLSQNGSAISAAARASGTAVVAACLRNASATARWLTGQGAGNASRPVAVIAAGERWPDGALRPALEDMLGAGAVIAALQRCGAGPVSPEAAQAATCFQATADIAAAVANSVSGQELLSSGYAEDVTVATELDSSAVVPAMTGEAFADPTRSSRES
jgi:2-phosphosulfolactate phosphatase